MDFKLNALRHSGIVAILTLTLIIAFGVYYYFYVEQQREYVTARNFRQLQTVANRIQSNILIVAKLFSKISEDKTTAESPLYRDYLIQANIQSLNEGVLQDGKTGEKLLFKTENNTIALVSDGRRMLRKEIDVRGLTDPASVFGVFDDIIIADRSGGIVYQRPEVLARVTSLDSLMTEDGSVLRFAPLPRSTGIHDVLIAGSPFKMFLYPLDIVPGQGVEPREWVLVGLAAEENVRKESMQISPTTIIVFSALVLLVAVCWPLLKLRFMGPRDELRRSDVLFAILSAFLAASLATFFVIDIFVIQYSFRQDLDAQLELFSAHIERNLNRELDDANAQLQDFVEKVRADNTSMSERVGRILHDRTSKYYPKSYPYLDVVYVINGQGRQVAKWSVQMEPTPMISVAERQYFSNLKAGRMWQRETGIGESMEFWLEPHYSFTTGLFGTVLSIPLRDLSTDPASSVAALGFGPLSLHKATTMPGYGFCVIDDQGDVLYHSDEGKNLYENLFEETDQDRGLKSAVFGRTSSPVTVRYWGELHRMFARPLRDLPWTVVVFRDHSVFGTVHLEILSVAVSLFFLHGLVLLLVFVLACLRAGWSVEWLWPADAHRVTYLRLVLYYLSIGGVLMLLRSGGVGEDLLLLSSVLLPNVAVILSFGMLDRRMGVKLHRIIHNKILMVVFWFGIAGLIVVDLLHPMLAIEILVLLSLCVGILFLIVSSTVSSVLRSHWWLIVGVFGAVYVMLALGVFGTSEVSIEGMLLWGVLLLGIGLVVRFLRRFQRPDFRMTYPLAATAFLVMAAVQPSLNFFQLATDAQLELMVKKNQLLLAKDLERRSDRIAHDYRAVVRTPADDILSNRLTDSLDVYINFFYGTGRWSGSTYYDSGENRRRRLLKHQLLRFFMPSYDQQTLESRGLIADVAADELWQWNSDPDGMINLQKKGFLTRDGRKQNASVSSFLPHYLYLLNRISPVAWLLLATCMAFVIVGIFLLLQFAVRRVFLIDVHVIPISSAVGIVPKVLAQNVLLLGPPSSGEDKLLKVRNIHSIDLVRVSAGASWADSYPYDSVPSNKVIAVRHFEHAIDDPVQNHQKLKFLEHLIHSMQRNVVLVSTVDPLSWMAMNGHKNGDGSPVHSSDEERWESLLSGFSRMQFREPTGLAGFLDSVEGVVEEKAGTTRFQDPASSLIECVTRECGTDPHLQRTALEILAEFPSIANMERPCDRFQDQMLESARTYYYSLWVSCSRDERRVLLHIAHNGYVGLPSMSTVEGLLRRNLLVHTPALRLMNRTFKLFVLEVGKPTDIHTAMEVKSVWGLLRAPILVLLLALVAFLFVTQKQFLESTMALVTLAGGLLPALFKIFSAFSVQRGESSPDR